jgi:AraC-like DNA-binding protein
MSVVFRAEDEPVASHADYWRHVSADTLVPVDLRVLDAPDFRSRILTGVVGAVRVTEVTAPRAELARTARLIRRSDPELYKIDVLVRGAAVVEQGGREARLRPGDLTLVDLSRPARWANPTARLVAVLFPRSLPPLPRDEVAQLTGVRIAGDQGTGALVSSLARQLPGHLDDGGVADGFRLGSAVLDLLTVALAARLDRTAVVPPDSWQRGLLQRVHAFIEQRLGDPGLSPGVVAAAHHVSLNYLHKLFHGQGTTVAAWIRQRRLERCSRDLRDPALRARPVSAIGARWGFTDPAHFSRAFRAAYGVPPGEYRLLHNPPSPR